MRCKFRHTVSVCLSFIIFIFSACSPQSEPQVVTTEAESTEKFIKKETQIRRNSLEWTEEIRKTEEPPELTPEQIINKLLLPGIVEEPEQPTPAGRQGSFFSEYLRFPTGLEDENLIYPSLPDLGNMDVSGMSSSLYVKLNDFLSGLKSKSIKNDNPVFAEKYVGVIFLYELSFYPDIDYWYIGTPFISMNNDAEVDDTYEIPVRVITKNGKFNCWIVLDPSKASGNEFVINQVVLGDLS